MRDQNMSYNIPKKREFTLLQYNVGESGEQTKGARMEKYKGHKKQGDMKMEKYKGHKKQGDMKMEKQKGHKKQGDKQM